MEGLSSHLLRHSGLYALGNVALKASGLVLAFLYLNPVYLSVDGFGYFSLLFITSQLGIFVVGLGLSMGLLKFMTDPAYGPDRQTLPFTVLLAAIGAAVVALGVFWGLARLLAGLMLDNPARAGLVHLMALYVVLKVLGRNIFSIACEMNHSGLLQFKRSTTNAYRLFMTPEDNARSCLLMN